MGLCQNVNIEVCAVRNAYLFIPALVVAGKDAGKLRAWGDSCSPIGAQSNQAIVWLIDVHVVK